VSERDGIERAAYERAAQTVEGLRRLTPYEYNSHPCSMPMKRAADAIRALPPAEPSDDPETDHHVAMANWRTDVRDAEADKRVLADLPDMTGYVEDAPAGVDEVTEEMVEAGAKMLDPQVWSVDAPPQTRADTLDFHARRQDSARQASDVYLAMRAARPAGGQQEQPK
jgi:hypothetical protein